MTFYIVSFVGRVDEEGKPVLEPTEGKPSVREVPFWDERNISALTDDYKANGVLHLQRLGTQHAPGRPLEHKGTIAIFAPHLISIEVDLKAAFKQPKGPVPFKPRG